MEPVNITYRIKLSEKVTEEFDFALDGKTFELINKEVANPPKWAELGFRQCSHCPLKAEQHPHCPVALQLHTIVERFHDTRSIDEVEVEVITDERHVIQTTAIQRVIASMLGLVFPISGCPKTAYMRPLARFHSPMSNEEETVFNVTGMYLLAQYFLTTTGTRGQFDFSGLTKIYEDMHTLNVAVASRLKGATQSDSVKNAVTLLDMYSTLVPMLIEDQLAEMRPFFRAYVPESAEAATEKPKTNYLEKAKAFMLELTPVDEKQGGEPEWLKAAKAGKSIFDVPDDAGSKAASPAKPAAPEPMITSSGLSLSLEPIEGEKPIEPKKASFNLPEDDKPASTGFFRPIPPRNK